MYPKKVLGLGFFTLARVLAKLNRKDEVVKALGIAQHLEYKPRESLLWRIDILKDKENLWQQKNVIEDYLQQHPDIALTKRLAKYYIDLEMYKQASNTLSTIEEDIESLDLLATSLSRQNRIPEYTKTLEKLLDKQKTPHRYNQLFFAYGRLGNQKGLTRLFKETLSSDSFSVEQKDKFIRATIEGLSRSFYYKEICTLHDTLASIYSSELLSIAAAMAYELEGKTEDALKIYSQPLHSQPQYTWWTTVRQANIFYTLKRYKKAYLLLSELFSDSNIKNKTPPTISLVNARSLAKEGNYKEAGHLLLDLFPARNINIWNDSDDSIFTNHYEQSRQFLLEGAAHKEEYLKALEVYSCRLAEKRLWKTAIAALQFTAETFSALKVKVPEKVYTQLARSYMQNEQPEECLRTISRGLKTYPDSLDLYYEKAQLYTKISNIYRAKETWDYVYSKFDASTFPQHYFTLAAEANLIALDLERHEQILAHGQSIYGENDRTLSHYAWQSLCAKTLNMNLEKTITGDSAFSGKYTYEGLFNDLDRYSRTILQYTYNDEMSHRRKHRSLQVYSLSLVDSWKSKNSKSEVEKTLKKISPLLGLSIPKSFHSNLIRLIVSSRTDPEKYLSTIKETILTTPSGRISHSDWLIIYQVLITNKFLYVGYLAREKAIEAAANESSSGHLATYYNLQKKFHAQLELNDFSSAEETLLCIDRQYPEQITTNELWILLHAFTGSSLEEPIRSNTEYKKLLHNKSVAIVGPAPSKQKQGDDIDSNSTVIRFNYRGAVNKSEWSVYGKKINVSYQNGPNVRAYLNPTVPEYMKDLDLYNVDFIPNGVVELDVNSGLARVNNPRVKSFNGVLMAVPAVAFDILPFRPKSIAIYGTNFYLSATQYNKSYTVHKNGTDMYKGSQQDISRLLELTGAHDLIVQRRFVKSLLAAGRIRVDKECQKVLDISDEDYMKRMEQLYAY